MNIIKVNIITIKIIKITVKNFNNLYLKDKNKEEEINLKNFNYFIVFYSKIYYFYRVFKIDFFNF